MKILSKMDQFLKSFERANKRSYFIKNLEKLGFKGTEAEMVRDYNWLMGEPEPKPNDKPNDIEGNENE